MQHCTSEKRLETGALKSNDDWAGVFIRTDEAITYVQLLHEVKRPMPSTEFGAALRVGIGDLQKLLTSGFER